MAEMDRQRGERIRDLRDAHAWTQRQLADRLGVDPKTVHNWESGRELNATNLRELADLLKVSMDYIRFGEQEHPDLTAMFSPNGDGLEQLDRIEAAISELRTDLATTRDELAALGTGLTKQLRSLARKLDTAGPGRRSQPGG